MIERAEQKGSTAVEAIGAFLIRFVRTISPVTTAVALTALSAAALFVATDMIRTVSEHSQNELAAVEIFVGELTGAELTPAALTSSPIRIEPITFVALEETDFTGVMQRAGGAFAAAFIVIGLAWRRREDAPLDDERRHYRELIASVEDEQRLLARRYHEEKLRAEAANHSKISFLAHLSHDIRTPLNHIIGFADLMRHETYGPLGDARYGTYVETIKGSGERLLNFFASILELAEFESGRKFLRQDAFSADDFLVAICRRYRSQALRAGLTIGTGLPTGATLIGDRFCLERMLANLIENAIRFTPQGGKVTIAAYAADNGIVLEVTDTGIGMSAAQLAAVSQPFAFGDAALTRERDGAGLGISISRAIAEQSGGHLAIDSRPGLGTTVAVALPLRPQELSSEAA